LREINAQGVSRDYVKLRNISAKLLGALAFSRVVGAPYGSVWRWGMVASYATHHGERALRLALSRLWEGFVKHYHLSVAIATAVLLAASGASANGIVPKQLAGGPEEFAAMAAVDPAAAAIHSKAALLPFDLRADKAGGYSAELELPIEGEATRMLIFSGGKMDLDAIVRRPGERSEKSVRALATVQGPTNFGIEGASHEAELYGFTGVQPGVWNLKLRAGRGGLSRGFVLLEGQSDTQLVSYLQHRKQLVGERIGFIASLYRADAEPEVAFGKFAGSVSIASLRVLGPDGVETVYAMHDDGQHGDGLAGDGIYGADFVAAKAGQYLAQVMIRGRNAAGQEIVRTAEHPLPVVERSIAVAGTKAAAFFATSQERLQIAVPVAAEKAGERVYRAYAEVWGRDTEGLEVPVAWIGGMVQPKNGAIELGLDTRWIAKAAARAPFELRNLSLEDTDGYVEVARVERLPLATPSIAVKAARDLVVDDTMRMGPRPAALETSTKGVGSRLLLVHGYCSGGVWPSAQFSNASTFLDVNQNRTHDQFARLIQSFGSTWNSFGVVAHSQGGAASLHLYTYYWSGLDNAVGSRLIQSVGTPYQGTNLAGILAALGSWFGVGCGTNNDLTYSGASAWLSRIPTWARAKVNYYTTSFRTTNWWTNDYCQIATDLVLSDPEDGTTEQVKGQLPGAINRGHVTGQCHTAGMRDPAQYLDSTRNAVMNSNAAR
jgi:hypothetical protein